MVTLNTEKLRPIALGMAAFVMVVMVTFALVEGVASTVIVLYEVLAPRPSQPDRQYDELLGWAPRPNAYVPDAFGDRKYVRINAQGFRQDEGTSRTVAPGTVRVICSGDSFTYGQGVANSQSWCHLLSAVDPRIESVNLGEPGYGVDQAFLRFRRDGMALEHNVHIFGMIWGDLARMAQDNHHGTPKPVLRLDGDSLVTDNVPVPVRGGISLALEEASERLRVVQFAHRVLRRVFRPPADDYSRVRPEVATVATEVFAALHRLAQQAGARVVLLYLPTEQDVDLDQPWRAWAHRVSDSLGLDLIDLTPVLRELPRDEVATFFIPRGTEDAGHYTEGGNRLIAEALLPALLATPRVAEVFEERTRTNGH